MSDLVQKNRAKRAAKTVLISIDGFEFRARRASLQAYIMAGRVPQYLADTYLKATMKREPDDDDEAEIEQPLASDTEAQEFLRFQRLIIEDSIVEPKIVFEDRELKDGEMYASEFDDSTISKLFFWAISGAHGVPVLTRSGEVTAQAVENFRDDGIRPTQSLDTGNDSEDVLEVAV